MALAASSLALHRVVVAETARIPALGPLIYRQGPAQVVSALADFLVRQKGLRLANPRLAAEQFLGMVLGHAQLRLLLNARPAGEVRAGIGHVVDHEEHELNQVTATVHRIAGFGVRRQRRELGARADRRAAPHDVERRGGRCAC